MINPCLLLQVGLSVKVHIRNQRLYLLVVASVNLSYNGFALAVK